MEKNHENIFNNCFPGRGKNRTRDFELEPAWCISMRAKACTSRGELVRITVGRDGRGDVGKDQTTGHAGHR